jgi:hypothetical protein
MYTPTSLQTLKRWPDLYTGPLAREQGREGQSA